MTNVLGRSIAFRSAVLVGSKAIQDLLSSLLFIWLARSNQTGYGLIMFGLSVAMLLRSIQSMGLDQYTLRELTAGRCSERLLLARMARLKLLLSFAVIAVFLLIAFIKEWESVQILLVLILLLGQITEGLADTYFNMLRALGRSVNEGVCRTGPNLMAALYGIVVLATHMDIMFFAGYFLIGGGGKLIFALSVVGRLSGSRGSSPKTDSAVNAKPLLLFVLISFMGMFYNEVQVFWLKHLQTLETIAHYRVAVDLTSFACGAFATQVAGGVLFPLFVSLYQKKDRDEFTAVVHMHFKRLVVIGLGIVLFLLLYGDDLLLLVYGSNYLPSTRAIPYVAIAVLFSFINNFIVFALLAMHREKRLCLYLLLPVGLSILVSPGLITTWGASGAAASLLVCRVGLSVILLFVMQSQLHLFSWARYRGLIWSIGWAVLLFGLVYPLDSTAAGTAAFLVYLATIRQEGTGRADLAKSGN
ncbi:MAG: hypothetical protein D6B25_17325 [Desulfobulbaceae bacterium]|nr:MAG: hypothetical protein D6B25_17325 [Desulfobulbaceae bacterium]